MHKLNLVTTVGYGDFAPKSIYGKMIGSMAAIFGSLFVALPISILTGIFGRYYHNEKRNKKIIKKYSKIDIKTNLDQTKDYYF